MLDVVALLLAVFDLFRQTGKAFCVECVARVEILHSRLVELGQRCRFQLQAIHGEIFGHRLAHALDESTALLVQLLHRHFGCRGAQRVYELALDQLLQLLRLHRAQAQRLRGRCNRVRVGCDAHVELGDHVDAHSVLGDECFVATTHDF